LLDKSITKEQFESQINELMNCIAQSEPKELQKGYVVIEEGIKEKMMALNVFE